MESNNNTEAASSGRRSSRRARIIKIVAAVAVIILLALLLWLGPLFWTRTSKRAIIMVPENPTMEKLADTLARHFEPGYAEKVMRGAKAMGGAFRLRPGAYEIPQGSSAFSGARKIGRGQQYIVTVALNNLRTRRQIAERVAGEVGFAASQLLAAMNDARLLSPYGLTPANAEAIFIADNYQVYWSITPEDFMKKMGDHYNEFWNAERRKKASKLGLSPAEVATIASIADEETSKSDEKARICRLYFNRLQKGMRLQADPTVKFALGDFGIKRVTSAMTHTESPFNTYRNAGLPPSPIRITDPATIDAFLDSKPTDDLYMCAREDFSGYHNFTSSFDEHKTNAARYQRKLNAMEIK